ncbi:MAG: hypothetical protein UX58_C0004G0076 [Candidatus Wolfebacteria bacterium GW2011_GWB2_46_69]|nr:MAG: hypothetical protein UX58_C0004G0076 [Candidatus Wolfebacteria bacterium GW2011_GWB2_46_69]
MKRILFFIVPIIVLVVGVYFFAPSKNHSKVLVIGIDGATWDIAQPMIDRGELPTLKMLIDSGISGHLASIDQPVVPAAWVSFATGQESGSTGVFDFLTPISNSYDFRIIAPGELKTPALWELIGNAGKKVGLINFLFYPAPVVNGFSISGELTPADLLSELADSTYPKSLNQELSAVGPYHIDAKKFEDPEGFLKSINTSLVERTNSAEYLVRTKKVDASFVIFNETNRLQHFFWKYQDPRNSAYIPGNPYERAISDHYKALDNAIKRLIAAADYKIVSINTWLQQQHLISFSPDLGQKYADIVNWHETQAFFPSQFQGIFINATGRYPQGIVTETQYETLRSHIIDRILTLRDPQTNALIVTKAERREDAYPGANNASLPDIILTFAPGYHASNEVGGALVRPSTYWSGIHNQDGMYILSHPEQKPTKRDAHILDLAPTILQMLDIPIPKNLTGTPII